MSIPVDEKTGEIQVRPFAAVLQEVAVRYADFLDSKRRVAGEHGRHCTADDVHPYLHPWQREIVAWAVRRGRAALWEDTGLGKTIQQLEWARLSGSRALVVAPLAVCAQTVAEARTVGVDVRYVREDSEHDDDRIRITNYELADRFDPTVLDAVVLDEASILKAHDGKTRTRLINHFAGVPARLACTATPAPNDPAELANQAEFLGLMTRAEMLASYFIHDSDGWRLKGHARAPMFAWMASWAVALRRPSDLGHPDDGYVLPTLHIHSEVVESDALVELEGTLFPVKAALKGVTGRAAVRKATLKERVARAVELVNDCGTSPRISAAMEREEPGTGQGLPGANERPPEPAATGTVRAGRRAPGDDQDQGQGEPGSSGFTGSALATVQDRSLGLGGDVRPGMRDLRSESGDRSQGKAARGSRPRHGHGPGCSVPALQSGARAPGGRPDPDHGDVPLHHACRDQWLIWCGLNSEQDALVAALGSQCVSIDGRTPLEKKIEIERDWREGRIRILITKPDIFSYGMNWQHCARTIFVGLSDSYEKYYQCIRRLYRYGQRRDVHAHVVLSDAEKPIADNIARKQALAADWTAELVAAMNTTRRAVA